MKIWNLFEITVNDYVHYLIVCTPILLLSSVTNLKLLTPIFFVANILMVMCLGVIFYFIMDDLPSMHERKFVATWETLPLFFGSVIYSFEGIGLVLPLQNAMKVYRDFHRPAGVLNIGMLILTCLAMGMGFFGYLKHGETVEGNLLLNFPDNLLARMTKIIVCLLIPTGYYLQLIVAIQITWPSVKEKLKISCSLGESVFRSIVVSITIAVAINVTKLSLFISLIGGICSTTLALLFPPIIDLVSDVSRRDRCNKNLREITEH